MLTHRTILILASDTALEPLRAHLSGLDYQPLALSSLAEALSLSPEPPQLVLIAPEAQGYEAHLAALAASPWQHLPRVLLSGNESGNESAALAHCLAGEAADYLAFDAPASLVRLRLERVIEQQRMQAAQQTEAEREMFLKLEHDLQVGREIQAGFLPESLPEAAGWDLAARFRPAREVAGDFYDAFFMINNRRIGFIVADVCDKGVGAALFMAIFRTLLRSGAQQNASLGWMGSQPITEKRDWLTGDATQRRQSLPSIGSGPLMNAVLNTNNYITENHMLQGYFATLFFGVLDPRDGTIVYINGGHNPPLIVRKDGTRTSLRPTGPAVGMLPDVSFQVEQTQLAPGDLLYLYTDGVPEARAPNGDFFTEARMNTLLQQPARSASEVLERVDRALHEHVAGAVPFDDITMMALYRLET